MKKKVITDWSIYENDEIDEKATTAQGLIEDNIADFPGLPFTPAQLLALIVAFHTAVSAPLSPTKTATINSTKTALLEALKKIGLKINEIADGDELLLAKSGYPLAKNREPIGPLAAAGFKKVESTPGGFKIDLDKVEHAESYLVLTTPANQPAPADFRKWQWHFFHKASGTITGLDASTKYKIVPVALGNSPTLNFGDAIERTTQG
jgi:hypothetical protein